jgi:RNA polymerase sigma-70 factor (ECF subfamily)
MHLSGDFDDWRAFGDYLRILARQAVPRSLRVKLDESDVVQESLLQAFRQKHEFRGQTQAEFLAWLRRILERQLCDVHRKFHRAKRDVARERAISSALELSSCQLEQFADTRQATASDKAMRTENVLRVSARLQQLSTT